MFVEASLFALGAEEPAVPQFAEYARTLHGGLEPLEQTLRVFSFTKVYDCQMPLLWVVFSCFPSNSSNAIWIAITSGGKPNKKQGKNPRL